ncbi:MAG: hypothetical protein OXS29_07870 [bacterium]|nr:hypothetical protein [bacterium]MDE0287358.1 hypothetical protein [bacterium]MDE0439177.1 hypothetical protein [bacterium]
MDEDGTKLAAGRLPEGPSYRRFGFLHLTIEALFAERALRTRPGSSRLFASGPTGSS